MLTEIRHLAYSLEQVECLPVFSVVIVVAVVVMLYMYTCTRISATT